MKQKAQSRILAILLIFCLFAGLFQCAGIAASAAELPSVSANTIAAEEKDETWLQSEIDRATKDQAIVLPAKDLTLTKPIIIPEGKAVIIKGVDKDKSIITTELKDEWKPSDKALLIMEAHSTLTIENLTIDGNNRARCILVNEGKSELTLTNVTIQNGASTQYSGVAIHSSHPSGEDGNKIEIKEGCVFKDNIASTTNPTSGGAIYIGKDCTATLNGTANNPICFSGNTAHSGACIYAYKAYVYAEHCEFGNAKAGNKAGQRGGALHCHGTMVLKDCTITNNSSGQYGGGIYISASSGDYDGVAVLDNTTITGNAAQNGGGGVFLASGGALYLRNQSSVIENTLNSDALKIEGDPNNVYYSGETGKIIACDQTLGKIGISTVSPTYRKLSVYSLGTIPDETFSDLNKRLQEQEYIMDANRSYKMSSVGNFSFDGDKWTLKHRSTDPGAPNDEKHCVGNLWLKLDPTYIHIQTGGEDMVEDQPYVVFDYNLPGMKADVYPSKALGSELKVGSKIHAPLVPSVIRKSGVEFTFLGWSTQPEGGETEGMRVIARIAGELGQHYPEVHLHIVSGDSMDIVEQLDKGLIDFALLVGGVNAQRYEHIRLPGRDTWGVLMRKDHPLAQKSAIRREDLYEEPLLLSRQIKDGSPVLTWMGRTLTQLNVVSTHNLIYNASLMVEEGLGVAVTLDGLINTTGDSPLCYRPLSPRLEVELFLAWKRYQTFSPAAAKFLELLQKETALET